MYFVQFLDYASVFVFALTGALAASRQQLDIVGFIFLASLTAVGGGTVRDVVLDRNPVFWTGTPGYVLAAVAAAVLIFFTAHRVESRLRAILWLDACALAVAVPAGVGVAMLMSQPAVIIVIMGIATGCLGGLLRDVVCNEVPMVLRQGELYVTAACFGAIAGVAAQAVTTFEIPSLLVCGVVTFLLRAGSLLFGWKLPVYKSRPPRA